MKTWPDDHPKAGLMARKRAAILEAAQVEFLHSGYKGTSMEGIAAAAGVSIMTLYRHAESKDDLFGAVIARACSPVDDAGHQDRQAAMLRAPLRDALMVIGPIIQDRLTSRQTTALLRTVIAGSDHSPRLAEMAYGSLIGSHVDKLADFLARRSEGEGITEDELRGLCEAFVNRLAGVEQLRLLLGLDGATDTERQARAAAAADELSNGLGVGR